VLGSAGEVPHRGGQLPWHQPTPPRVRARTSRVCHTTAERRSWSGTRRVRVVGQGDPAGGVDFLDRDRNRTPRAGSNCRNVTHNLVEQPLRRDDRQHPWRSGECRLQRRRVAQPKGSDHGGGRDAVRVVADLAGMQRHPQPDSLRFGVGLVVHPQLRHQCRERRLHERCLVRLGRHEREDRVAADLAIAVLPRQPRGGERRTHDRIEPLSYCPQMRLRSPRITEPLDVGHHDQVMS
jgi:hypothetical protein